MYFTEMIPGWSPTKVVHMVLIGHGQEKAFQNAIFVIHIMFLGSKLALP